ALMRAGKPGNDSPTMRTDLFDFELPPASIALRPVSPRDSARMLVVRADGVLRDRVMTDLPQWLEPGDQLVVNDTRVRPAQLSGRRIGRDTEPKRAPDDRDAADYQTMFASNEGAVAAPTAGLHFTPALEAALRGRGVELHRLTLHVGAGTFLPVKAEDTSGHKMHAEWGSIF